MARKTNHNRSTRTQTFSIPAPAAQSVQLVGDFTHWQKLPIPLRKEGNGVWRASVELEPGEYHYRFLVDGQWRDDPDCARRIPNPFGTQDSVRQVV
jgi:1,4-alpha-glucan branching enzyme